MPSTYSKRWKKRKIDKESEDIGSQVGPLSPGGPLRRSTDQTQVWDENVGKSLNVIPTKQIPTIRIILQRYRCERISQPDASVAHIAQLITDETMLIWNKARIPTASRSHCVDRVKTAVESWYKWKKHRHQQLPDFDVLLDLKPKPRGQGGNEERELNFLRDEMRKQGKKKKKGGKSWYFPRPLNLRRSTYYP